MPTAQVTDDETMPLLEIPQSGYKCGTMSLEAPGAHSTLGAQENVAFHLKNPEGNVFNFQACTNLLKCA